MKNFRKVLALVLVVATLFSFTAMTSAAYEDASDISYNEAVTVLSAVGVLNGYEVDKDEYEFKPTQTISREEMAKMIAVLANAGTDVSTLYASACTFADVAKTRWSASYVAYCAKTGIVAGRSATTFDPTGKVTGLETAKMLLVVLGFDAEEQGYVGADWKVNVLRDAKVMGLLNNFAASYDIEAAITREEAAQMMLNALEAPCVVGLVSKNVVTVTNALVSYTTKTAPNTVTVSTYAKLKDAITAGSWSLYGNVLISDDLLGATLFGLTRLTTSDRDCYGRPATSWKYKTVNGTVKTIGVYADSPIFESGNTSKKELTTALNAYNGLEAVLFVDGKQKDSPATTQTVADVLTLANDDLGKGVQVEVFFNDKIITVVVINTYLGYVSHPNTAKGTVEIIDGDKTYNPVNTFGFKPADEGTDVLYWICGNGDNDNIHTVEVVEPTRVTLHAVRNAAGYFCDSDEKNYEYAKYVNENAKEVVKNNLGNEVWVYTDKFGYVLDVAPVGTALNVSVLVGTSTWATSAGGNSYVGVTKAYTAKFVEFDAEKNVVSEALPVTAATYNADDHDNTAEGKYDVLVKWQDDGKGNRNVVDKGTVATGEFILNKASGIITCNGTNWNKAGDNNTQYLLRLFDTKTGKYVYKYFDGAKEIDATYKLNRLQYFNAGYGSDYTGDYEGKTESRYLSYVYADASYVAESSLAFVLGYYSDETYITEGGVKVGYHLFYAVVDGEDALVAYTDVDADNVGLTTETAFKAVKAQYKRVLTETHDGKPVYLASAVCNTVGYDFLVSGNSLTYVDNDRATQTLHIADDATIVAALDFVDDAKDSVDTYTADQLINLLTKHGWSNIYGWFNMVGGVVTDLYILVKESTGTVN